MDQDGLERANEINSKIRNLNRFIFYAERTWTGKLIQNAKEFFFKSNSYEAFESKTLPLDTKLKNKVLDVIRQELKELQEELENI